MKTSDEALKTKLLREDGVSGMKEEDALEAAPETLCLCSWRTSAELPVTACARSGEQCRVSCWQVEGQRPRDAWVSDFRLEPHGFRRRGLRATLSAAM